VLQGRGQRQGVGLAVLGTVLLVQHGVDELGEPVHIHPLPTQAIVVLTVHHAVLRFLDVEILDFLQQLGIADLVAVVAHAVHEELLARREDDGQGIPEAGLERIAAEPVLRNVLLVESELQALTRNDGVLGCGMGHGGSFTRQGSSVVFDACIEV